MTLMVSILDYTVEITNYKTLSHHFFENLHIVPMFLLFKQNVLPSAILVSVIFSLTEAEQYPNLKSSKSAHQSSPYSFSSSSSPDVTRRSSSGYPSYDAFVDSRYEFPSSPVSGTDGDILESSDHSNVEDYTQPASNPSPVVVIPLKFGQRRQVKQHHSSSYCMYIC